MTSAVDYNNLVGDWESEVSRKYLCPCYEEVIRETKRFYLEMKTTCDWNGVNPGNIGGAFTGTPGNKSRAPSPYSAPCDEDTLSHSPLKYNRTIPGRKIKYCSKCVRHRNSPKKGRWNTTHYSAEHTGKPAGDNDNDASPLVEDIGQDSPSLL